jgi:hypothetical protein
MTFEETKQRVEGGVWVCVMDRYGHSYVGMMRHDQPYDDRILITGPDGHSNTGRAFFKHDFGDARVLR